MQGPHQDTVHARHGYAITNQTVLTQHFSCLTFHQPIALRFNDKTKVTKQTRVVSTQPNTLNSVMTVRSRSSSLFDQLRYYHCLQLELLDWVTPPLFSVTSELTDTMHIFVDSE